MARLGGGTTTDTTSTSNELYYAGEAFRLAYDVGEGTGSRRVGTDFTGFTITAKATAVAVTGGDVSTAAPYGLCQVDSGDAAKDTFTTKANCSSTWIAGKKPGGGDAIVDLIGDVELDAGTRNGKCMKGGTAEVLTGSGYITQALCIVAGFCNSVGNSINGTYTTQTDCVNANGTWTQNVWNPNTSKAIGKFYIYIPTDILSQVGYTEIQIPQPGEPLYIAYSVDYTEVSDGTGDTETRVIETDVIGFRWTPMFTI